MLSDAIDIVLLNCNNKGYIENCIESIYRCTDGKFNLIVVDQNSKDGSREWLAEKSVCHLILNKMNVGVAVGRNQAIKSGRYPWILLIDSDVVIKDENWLDKMWNYTIDRRIGVIETRVISDKEKHTFSRMSFALIRRKTFEDIGCFDPKFYINEDLEWWTRLEHSNWKTAYCYDTDILHYGKKTMEGCLKKVYNKLMQQGCDKLYSKYTYGFIKRTLAVNVSRRIAKELELLKGEDNG